MGRKRASKMKYVKQEIYSEGKLFYGALGGLFGRTSVNGTIN